MSERFTETLRQRHRSTWDLAVHHSFVDQLLAGSVPDRVMADYLIQDHRFLDAFVTLVGSAMANSDRSAARLRFGRFAGMVCGEEDTYFLRAFEALGVTPEQRRERPDTPATAGLTGLMREAAASGSYAAILAVLNVAEWLYRDWAHRAGGTLPPSFVHREWITLHSNPDFDGFVDFLRAELDRVGPRSEDEAEDFFARAVQLELDFFDAVLPDGGRG